MFILKLYLKNIFYNYKRFIYFILSITLLSVLAGFLGNYFMYSKTIGNMKIFIVDEDQSMESGVFFSMISTMDTYKGSVEFEKADRESASQAIKNNLATAAFVIPEGFTADVKSGVNPPYSVILNNDMPLHSIIIEFFSDTFSEMLKTAQIAIYSGLNIAEEYGGSEARSVIFLPINLKFMSFVLSREALLEIEEVSVTNNFTAFEYYFFAVFFLVTMFQSILFVDIVNQNKNYILNNLINKKIKPIYYHTFLFLSLFIAMIVIQIILITLIFFMKKIFFLPLNWDNKIIFASLIISFYSALITILVSFLTKKPNIASTVIAFFCFLSFAIGGGIIPVSYFHQLLKSASGYNIFTFLINLLSNGLTILGIVKITAVILILYIFSFTSVCSNIFKRNKFAR